MYSTCSQNCLTFDDVDSASSVFSKYIAHITQDAIDKIFASSVQISSIVQCAQCAQCAITHAKTVQHEMQCSTSSSHTEQLAPQEPQAQLSTCHQSLPTKPVSFYEFLEISFLRNRRQSVRVWFDVDNKKHDLKIMIRRFNVRAECITFDEVFQKLGFTHQYQWGDHAQHTFNTKNNVIIEILVQIRNFNSENVHIYGDIKEPIVVATTLEHCGKSMNAHLCLDKDGRIFVCINYYDGQIPISRVEEL
jgi:hypothetical protein